MGVCVCAVITYCVVVLWQGLYKHRAVHWCLGVCVCAVITYCVVVLWQGLYKHRADRAVHWCFSSARRLLIWHSTVLVYSAVVHFKLKFEYQQMTSQTKPKFCHLSYSMLRHMSQTMWQWNVWLRTRALAWMQNGERTKYGFKTPEFAHHW